MSLVMGYGIAVGWAIAFLALAFVVRWVFGRLNFFSLRSASDRKDAAVGPHLRGLYIALRIISPAAIQSTRRLGWGLTGQIPPTALRPVFLKHYHPVNPGDLSPPLHTPH